MHRRAIISGLVGVLACIGAAGAAQDRAAALDPGKAALRADPSIQSDPTSILVRWRPAATPAARGLLRSAVGGTTIREYEIVPGLEHLRVGSAEAALALLAHNPLVEYAEPDYVVRTTANPNDTYLNLLWGLHNTGQSVNGDAGTSDADIDGPEAWDTFTGDPNFRIAVIDTGANYNHADLSANMWINPGEVAGNGVDDDGNGYVDDVRGWDFYNDDNDPMDGAWHGTHVSGTIGAVGNNGTGVTGVNWRCKIVPLRFLGPTGGFTSDAIDAVQYCRVNGIRVSNNSWGGGGYSQSLYDAIAASRTVGHLFVAAAGNGGSDQVGDNNDSVPFYPASYNLDNIISVAATDNDDRRAGFSNYGRTSVDLGAPGVNIASTYQSSYAYSSGTSMAAPHVSGVVGLVYAQNPGWSYDQVRSRILSTVRPVSALANITVTGGVVNAAAALVAGPGNTAPSVTIGSPADGSSFDAGSSVSFAGSASDAEDGNLSGALVWTSSRQGQIGTGASFSTSALVVGTHTITASVVDSGGLNGSDSIIVTINDTTSGPPAAPSGLSATLLPGRQVRLDWTDNADNEASFEIERQKAKRNGWTATQIVGTPGADSTTFTDSPGRGTFRYRIRAVNSAGASAWTAYVQLDVR